MSLISSLYLLVDKEKQHTVTFNTVINYHCHNIVLAFTDGSIKEGCSKAGYNAYSPRSNHVMQQRLPNDVQIRIAETCNNNTT